MTTPVDPLAVLDALERRQNAVAALADVLCADLRVAIEADPPDPELVKAVLSEIAQCPDDDVRLAIVPEHLIADGSILTWLPVELWSTIIVGCEDPDCDYTPTLDLRRRRADDD